MTNRRNADTSVPVSNRPKGDWLRGRVADATWRQAVHLRNRLKRLGFLGPLEGVSAYLGPKLLAPSKEDTQVQIQFGLKLTVPGGSPSYRNFTTGLYETDVTELILSRVGNGMTFVDLGANIGYYSLIAAHLVGEAGKVYAFEADREAYTYLIQNTADNLCHNVVPANLAVSDLDHQVYFSPTSKERGHVSSGRNGAYLIAGTTLDTYFRGEGWPRLDFIKIDIEGSEERALRGMAEVVRRNPTVQIIMEVNRDAILLGGGTPASLFAAINALGFDRGFLVERRQTVRLHSFLQGSRAVHNLLLSRELA